MLSPFPVYLYAGRFGLSAGERHLTLNGGVKGLDAKEPCQMLRYTPQPWREGPMRLTLVYTVHPRRAGGDGGEEKVGGVGGRLVDQATSSVFCSLIFTPSLRSVGRLIKKPRQRPVYATETNILYPSHIAEVR